MENLLEVRGLTKHYPQFDLKDASFNLPAGVIMGFIGENGAGKSTTLKLILNLIRKDGGTISLLGHDSTQLPPELREEIGVVFDECNIPEMLTSAEVRGTMQRLYRTWDNGIWSAYMDAFKLPDHKKVNDFSRGMKVKLMLAIALSHHPRLLLLDEATSGLDPVIREEILEVFQKFILDEDHSILISTHILSDLEKVCDYVLFIHEGRVRFMETRDELHDEYALWKGSQTDFALLDPAAVVGKRRSPYGVDALVLRHTIPANATLEPASIEDIMLYIIKDGAK